MYFLVGIIMRRQDPFSTPNRCPAIIDSVGGLPMAVCGIPRAQCLFPCLGMCWVKVLIFIYLW